MYICNRLLNVGLLLDVSLETVLNLGYENVHLYYVTKCRPTIRR